MNGSPVAGLVRGWADLYTRGMPAEVRAARRDELDDDLWCEHEEAEATGRSRRSLDADRALRLFFGIPADISWRLTYSGRATRPIPDRSSSTSTSVLGVLAIVAGLSWLIMLILVSSLGDAAWTWFGGVAVQILWVGGLAFLAVAVGLSWRFQDRISLLGAAGVLLMTLGALGAITGVGGWIVGPLMVGSAMLLSDLARSGVVSRLIAIVQATIAILFTIGFLVQAVDAGGWAWLTFGPYMLSWVAIGVSLIRGVPPAPATSG
jgi:hypothetical protein